jgi:hypothetical protein
MRRSFFEKVKDKFYVVPPLPKVRYHRLFEDDRLQAKFDRRRQKEEQGVSICEHIMNVLRSRKS